MRTTTRRTLLATTCAALLGATPAAAAPPTVTPSPTRAAPTLVASFGPEVRARLAADGLTPRQLHGLSVPTRGEHLATRAADFLASHRDVLRLGAGDFEAVDTQSPRLRGPSGEIVRHIVRLRQRLGGLPVEGRVFTVTMDAALRVVALGSDAGPLKAPAVLAPTLDATAAARAVEGRFAVRALAPNASLVLVPTGADGTTRLAWRVPTAAIPLVAHFIVWVDAHSGAILRDAPAGPHQGLARPPQRNPEEEP